MGIRGLKSFIEDFPILLEDYKLYDTKVIIDGNNLYYVLYYCFRISHQFGGDYDLFAKNLQRYFRKLLSCKISPYVIFDGGYEQDDKKLETILQRAKDRIQRGGFLSCVRHAKVLPILTYETFKNVLTELQIPHATCQFEADEEIAALASQWKCPVMSNDSDFFIFDLPGGFIPLDYMDVDVAVSNHDLAADSEEHLMTKIYFVDKFSKMFSVDKSLLPLFATLVGNDYVDSRMFENFLERLRKPKRRGKKCLVPKCQSKISRLLYWLDSVESCEAGIEEVLLVIKSKKCNYVKSSLEKSIEMYVRFQRSSFLIKYFDSKSVMSSVREISIPVLYGYNGSLLPVWFCAALQQSMIAAFMQNAVFLHRVILLCQVENLHHPSSYKCSQFIRQAIYGILLGGDPPSRECDNPSKQTHVVEYDRNEKNLCKKFVKPLYLIPGVKHLPNLDLLPQISLPERIDVIKHVLQCSNICSIVSELYIVCCVIKFWVQNASPKVTCNHMRSLILYIILENVGSKNVKCESDSIDMASLSTAQLEKAKTNLNKYFHKPECNSGNPFDNEITHGFSQFQACLLDTINLNQLLMCPFHIPEPMHIFNGTFLYNFCRDLDHRPNVPLFIAEMLVRHSPLSELYTALENTILDTLEMKEFTASTTVVKRRKKKNRRTNSTENNPVVSESKSSCRSEEDMSSPEVIVEAACEISNQFASDMVD